MKKKDVIFSFDYELFFGVKSGTVKKTLIEPTSYLLNQLEKSKARGCFFIDYLMIERLKALQDQDAQNDLKCIEIQLKDMVMRGHRIELHLHPHWLDAVYEGNGIWDFSIYEHYSMSSIDPELVRKMFVNGTGYLNRIAREIEPNYTVCAYRAGGWAIQPFSTFYESFKENGLVVDSSVMPGVYATHRYSQYDFRVAPTAGAYRFSDDVIVENKQGKFIEIPIASYNYHFLFKVINRISSYIFRNQSSITDGSHFRQDAEVERRNIFKSAMMPLSMSRYSPLLVIIVVLFQKASPITIIDHPKDFSMSTLISIKWLMKFCNSKMFVDYL